MDGRLRAVALFRTSAASRQRPATDRSSFPDGFMVCRRPGRSTLEFDELTPIPTVTGDATLCGIAGSAVGQDFDDERGRS